MTHLLLVAVPIIPSSKTKISVSQIFLVFFRWTIVFQSTARKVLTLIAAIVLVGVIFLAQWNTCPVILLD